MHVFFSRYHDREIRYDMYFLGMEAQRHIAL